MGSLTPGTAQDRTKRRIARAGCRSPFGWIAAAALCLSVCGNPLSAQSNLSIAVDVERVSDATSVTLTRDGAIVVAGQSNGSVTLWESRTGRLVTALRQYGEIRSVAVSPDGGSIAASSANGYVNVWSLSNIRSGALTGVRTLAALPSSALAFASGGKRIVCVGADGTTQLWDVRSGALLGSTGRLIAPGTAPLPAGSLNASDFVLRQEIDSPGDIRFGDVGSISQDRTYSLLRSGAGFSLRDFRTGARLQTFTGTGSGVTALAIAPDNSTVLSGTADGTLALWDRQTGVRLAAIGAHSGQIRSLLFAPRDNSILSIGADKTIRRWRMLPRFGSVVPLKPIYSAVVSNDGQDYLVWVPAGFYVGTPQAGMLARLTYAGQTMGLGQAFESLFQPYRFAAAVAGAAAAGPPVDLGGPAPSMRIVTPSLFDSQPLPPNFTITVAARDAGGGIGTVSVVLNGETATQEQSRGERFGNEWMFKFPATLDEGQNHIVVSATNSLGKLSSAEVSASVVSHGAVTSVPALYLMTVAIDKYRKPITELKSPVKSAEDFVRTISANSGSIYSGVTVLKVLKDDDALTRNDIAGALDAAARGKSRNDVFVLYLSGHGGVDEDGNYFYATAGYAPGLTPTDRAKFMLTRADILALWENVPCRKKLLLLDTCDAGSLLVDQQGSSRDPVANDPELLLLAEEKTLARVGGRMGNSFVGSSYYYTGRSEDSYALDDPDGSGHTAFATVLLNGILSGAEAWRGRVSLQDLEQYIERNLPDMPTLNTLYRQRVVVRGPARDYPFTERH
jgi:hypothetical protein